MVKQFSTARETQRGSQSYIEKRRGRREIEVTRMRRGVIKRGESKLASNQFLMCSPQSGPLREDSWSYREETREEGDRLPGGEKGESKVERQIQPVISS